MLILGMLILVLGLLFGCSLPRPIATEEGNQPTATQAAQATQKPTPTPEPQAKELTFGDTFDFDGFTITLGTAVEWDTVQNQFSDLDGADVIKLPIHIVNNSGETGSLNMFYIKKFGSKGTALESVGSYFDGEIDYAGEMRPGAEMDSFMAILYDGDGDYYIEFDNYSENLEVKLPIAK